MPALVTTPLVETIQESIDAMVSSPDHFMHTDKASLRNTAARATHSLYSMQKQSEPYTMSPFDDISFMLMEEAGFDLEQIWEMMQMQNGPMFKYMSRKVDELVEMGDIEEDIDSMEEEEEENSQVSYEEDEQELDEEEDDDEDDMMEDEPGQDDDEPSQDEEDILSDDESLLEDKQESRSSSLFSKKPFPKTQVDDDFFSVRQMEHFAELAEKWDHQQGKREIEANQDEEEEEEEDELKREFDLGLDFLGQDPDEEEEDDEDDDEMDQEDHTNDIMYEDFFGPRETRMDPPSRKHVAVKRNRDAAALDDDEEGYYDDQVDQQEPLDKEEEEEEDNLENEDTMVDDDQQDQDEMTKSHGLLSDDEEDIQHLSTFEKQQEKLNKHIQELESEAIAEKPWVMKGQAAAKDRPMNAILEEDLEVDYAAKPVPVVTEATTETLEDMIKSRIRDGLFDDVERKIPPPEQQFDPNRRLELDGEKSKSSLAQVYEQEYTRQTAMGQVSSEKDVKLQAAHREIEDLFKTLCLQLDALSNSHYTPNVPQAHVTVVPMAVSTPAISMEETLPSMVSDAAALAPHEVFQGAIQPSTTEMTSQEKKRERIKSSKKRKIEHQEKEMYQKAVALAKQKKGIPTRETDKQSKAKAIKELKKHDQVTLLDSKKPVKTQSKLTHLRL